MNRRVIETVIAMLIAAAFAGLVVGLAYHGEAEHHRLLYHPTNALQCATAELRWQTEHPGEPAPVDCSRF